MFGAGMTSTDGGFEARLAKAHAALRDTPGIQFDFAAAPPPEPPPGWLEPLVKLLVALGPALAYVFWGALALGLACVVWLIVREFLPARQGKRTPAIATDWRPDAQAARGLLADADRLAAQGRHAEAVHLLLFRSIEDLAARRPGLVRPSLTSRDIAGLAEIPPTPRDAFSRLARVVEASFFGRQTLDAAAFAGARADYEAFAFADAWR
jgi:hypothetical protein